MSRRLRAVVLTITVLCLVAPAAEAGGDNGGDRGTFSNRDVQGPAAFNFDGFVTLDTTTAPAAAIGRFFANGRGQITNGERTLVVGGTTFHQTFTCEYSVNPDGTGNATCIVMGFPNETYDFVIVKRRESVFFTATTPGVATILGATQRQR